MRKLVSETFKRHPVLVLMIVGLLIAAFAISLPDEASGQEAEQEAANVVLLPVIANRSASAIERPETPTNLTAMALSANLVQLDWQDNSTGEDAFYILEKDVIGSVPANTSTFVATNLAPNTYYCFRVYAKRGEIMSLISEYACATTLEANQTPAPTATNTPTATSTATPTASPVVTATVAPSATPIPTASATLTPTIVGTCATQMDIGLTYGSGQLALTAPLAVQQQNLLPASVLVADSQHEMSQNLHWVKRPLGAPARWEVDILAMSNPGRIGPFSATCHLVGIANQWTIDLGSNSFVRVQPTPTNTPTPTSTPTNTPTATNTPAANVWSVDFSSDFGVNAQEESCSKFTDVRVEQGAVVLAETFAGAGSQMYAQTPDAEKACIVKAGAYINLSVKGLQGAPAQQSYDLTNRIVTCDVRYVPALINQRVWVEFRIQDSQFRNESLPGFFVTAQDTTLQLQVGQGVRDTGFDAAHVTALKVENRADDPQSTVAIPGGEIFRHVSCEIK